MHEIAIIATYSEFLKVQRNTCIWTYTLSDGRTFDSVW